MLLQCFCPCHAYALRGRALCHALAMPLPMPCFCPCFDAGPSAMFLPWHCHALAMSLPCFLPCACCFPGVVRGQGGTAGHVVSSLGGCVARRCPGRRTGSSCLGETPPWRQLPVWRHEAQAAVEFILKQLGPGDTRLVCATAGRARSGGSIWEGGPGELRQEMGEFHYGNRRSGGGRPGQRAWRVRPPCAASCRT